MKRKIDVKKTIDGLCFGFLLSKENRKQANLEYDRSKAEIITQMNGDHYLEGNYYTAQYVNASKQVLDVQRLKNELPDIYMKFLKSQDCWTLVVNEKAS